MPIRTCIITRQKAEQGSLLRFTIQKGKIVFDEDGKRNPGRGGYIVPTDENIAKLPKLRKKIEYLLRASLTDANIR